MSLTPDDLIRFQALRAHAAYFRLEDVLNEADLLQQEVELNRDKLQEILGKAIWALKTCYDVAEYPRFKHTEQYKALVEFEKTRQEL